MKTEIVPMKSQACIACHATLDDEQKAVAARLSDEVLDALVDEVVNGEYQYNEGDVCFCVFCGFPAIVENREFRMMTPEEEQAALRDPQFLTMWGAVEEIRLMDVDVMSGRQRIRASMDALGLVEPNKLNTRAAEKMRRIRR